MSNNNNTDLNDVLSQLNIPEYYNSLGIQVVKSGKKHQCECPFCGDKDHFAYEPAGSKQGLWVCPKCNESGNAITLTAKLLNMSNGDAVKHIKKYLGVEDPPWEGNEAGKMTSGQQNKAGKATKTKQQPLQPKENNEGSMAPSSAIYDRFLELTHLTDSDREDLKKKRGFADALIDELKFRSGGNYIIAVVGELRKEFSDDDLVGKGLLVRINGALLVNNQLLNDKKLKQGRYLIPYLDKEGHCYHIRPHKLGFSGIKAQLYSEQLISNNPDWAVITEGEFKAAALKQWGFPTLAMPGTPSFAKQNFERMRDFLTSHEIKKVVIIFDSEEKGNPQFPNYKKDPEKRYDTEFWTYMNTYKLSKAGFDASIGFLPAEWRENGKVDFDAALAQGRTKSDIEKVINASITADEFRKSWEGEARRILERKCDREFTPLPIRRDFNQYVIKKQVPGTKGETYDQTISNFVINIKASFYTEDNIIRQVQLVNKFGESSNMFAMEPSMMAGVNEFRKFCYSKGNYIFDGALQDLNNIWKYEFSRDLGEVIYMPEVIGRLDSKIWLFGNMALSDGKIYRPDDDGVIWIDDKGYKPQANRDVRSTAAGNEGEGSADIKSIHSLSEQVIDINDVTQKIHHAIGGYDAETMVGWFLATIFSDDVFKEHRYFPLLFACGKMKSGKTTALSWMMSFFGKREEGFQLSRSTTQHGIVSEAKYRSSIPCWLDEYRNDIHGDKSELFRSMYNRQVSLKGTLSFKVKTYKSNATIVLSGEETPSDAAFFSRCVFLEFSKYKRDGQYLDWLEKNCEDFSSFTLKIILRYEELKNKVLGDIRELRDALISKGIDSRTAGNWAICAGTYSALVKFDPDYIRWVEDNCQKTKESEEEGHIINIFWDSIAVLWQDREIDTSYIDAEGEFLYIWYTGLYDKWAVYYRKQRSKEAFDKQTMLKYLMSEPYYVECKQRRMGKTRNQYGSNKKVYIIKVSRTNESIYELAEMIKGSPIYGQEDKNAY